MPTYEYRCPECGHSFDESESFDAPPEHVCPKCGTLAPRVFGVPYIRFKGTGFYSTDSKKREVDE